MQVETFDFIIIGAGTAGCVLANRLTEDPNTSVLLIEAGGVDNHPILKLPLFAGVAYNYAPTNWGYTAQEGENLFGREIPWPRGKVLGGTSSINGMMHIRGNPDDFDRWARSGAAGWSYDEVLPYFLKAEGNLDRDGEYHNKNGPFKVTSAHSPHTLYRTFINACESAGYKYNSDLNGKSQDGIGRQDFNIHRGRRVSASTAYLNPIKSRKNIRILTNNHVARVLFKNSRAIGVECIETRNKKKVNFSVTKEVIVSAGTVNSPQILQLSGIGDIHLLKKLDIPVVKELPSVGQNLQDHLGAYVQVSCRKKISLYNLFRKDRLALAIAQAILFRTGPATSIPLEAGGFVRADEASKLPDFQITFCPGLSLETTRQGQGRHGYLVHYYLARPKSRGTIEIVSKDPCAFPLIKPNSLSDPTDLKLMIAGLEIARNILAQNAFDEVRGMEISPGTDVSGEDREAHWIKQNATTVWHPTSTCKMGEDNSSVVNSDLKVFGINNLRVVDASIMPSITTGNTATPTIMIAEKASDLIKNDHSLLL
ncbi:MAG: choline dehydrogenase [Rhodospirillaceae bacterium]|nr:choline dehydrogenase [Rhodospirillaceae bacterium]